VDELPDVDWSCAVALLPLDEPVCACAPAVPNIAAVTATPSRPFSNLFIFMSLSSENGLGAKKLCNINEILWRRSLKTSPRRVRALAARK
jgi:hypothetical protein